MTPSVDPAIPPVPMRLERDALGERAVPADALAGIQTTRAVENFPVSGWPMPATFLRALVRLKRAAAQTNRALGAIPPDVADWIARAADEVLEGRHGDPFPVDVFQTGSGTSTNMNVNEVLANRAIQLAGGVPGTKKPVHPNDHVNAGQSSNDLIPTAAHVAAALALREDLLPALGELRDALARHARDMDDAVKIGRTHLQDATPVRMGQVMGGYAAAAQDAVRRLAEVAAHDLAAVALGGTAVGTGQNAHPEFAAQVLRRVSLETGIAFREAENHFAAQSTAAGLVRLAGELKGAGVALAKIANDLRFLASGPRCGLGELALPSLQPGSSIMPGKVNPVLCESLMQAAAWAVGAEAGVSFAAGTLSNFELSTAWPLASYLTLETVRILAAATRTFARRAVAGMTVDRERCRELCERSLALVTGLVPEIGYDRAAEIARAAAAENTTLREAAAARTNLSAERLDRLLDARGMTGEGS